MSVSVEEKPKMNEKFADGSVYVEEGARSTDGADNEWTEQEERNVRMKMDLRIIPVVTVLYLLCFIDRANIGNARIQGMEADLGLYGFRFNWALTVFCVPYLLVEIPSNVLLKRIGPKFYIPFLVFLFGVVSMSTAFVTSFETLCVARAFLGLAEGGTLPGIAFFLSCFYKRHELLFRIGIFVSSSSLAGAFGGLLATALSLIPAWGHGSVQLHSWRNIFFFEGIVSMAIAICGYFLLPSSPETCPFLSERERWIAAERIRREHKEIGKEKTEAWHIKRAVFNINNILCALGFFLINVTVQSYSLFLPTILSALGWTATKAQLFTVPPYAVAWVYSLFLSYASDRQRKRGIFIFASTLLVITGYIILITVESANLKYMAVFFAATGAYPLGPAFLSWGLNNAAGPSIRAVTGACIVSIGTFGTILATWTYISSDSPRYIKGHSINLGCQCAACVVSLLAICYCRWENRQRKLGKRDYRLEGLTEAEANKLGYRHPQFRYME